MRIRRRKHIMERLQKVAPFLIETPADYRGRWLSLAPQCDSMSLELGGGMGAFINEMALRNPKTLYIAFEKERDVIIKALEKTVSLEITNLYFVLDTAVILETCFEKHEVGAIYLNFSDPWPHWKAAIRRLTHRNFLKMYVHCLKPDGYLEFKTDNAGLFAFSHKELRECGWDITFYTEDYPHDADNILTEYEERFRAIGIPIRKLIALPPK